ncbi:MAG: formate dehydrogenase accessory sulfurtransferase FdhD [Proteobacteria bacterium]|jgi:FdhD protein|nr:formate dehydrogenase accessory sulfurtransferase FdhD [Pseudomonadota bacterium]MBT4106255.1 formate dehydrogenase accessory sulfurtransferase FdhD [Pseudomonadota bacterium]MBT4988905.1 formate dehydrogenase accessory sulfurtransferase FdhD [Pseudomonadota bacterium]MBT5190002.1 formate dehydrogenase accessory sulfurtransferase FdhD [Pseudomonadota bacterium]MBT5624433.1 formate dehydrogenase accessory sulfurtransferase FdhD [Pseudomonadota bacterium]
MPATGENTQQIDQPILSDQGLDPTRPVNAKDEFGEERALNIAGEYPLTIKVDDAEVVTLMTLGTYPEKLTLGYLRNQRLIDDISDIAEVKVDWERETVDVLTAQGKGIVDLHEKISKRTVTSGCGQGTIFSCTLDKLYDTRLPRVEIKQSTIYALLKTINSHNEIYRAAGAVHGCALCDGANILYFVEDVGRHNATDTIAGEMWLDGISGNDKIFYTTGRLTSEIVMKAAHMGVPVLISRSGITCMGLELAQDLGVTMVARAKGRHFLVYNGDDTVIYDEIPEKRS